MEARTKVTAKIKGPDPNKGSYQLKIKIQNKRSNADVTVGSIYFFVTNISERTAFLLQGLTYNHVGPWRRTAVPGFRNFGNKKYIFPTVKSALHLLFVFFFPPVLRCTRRAHSPCLAHEAPVMQAILHVYSSYRIFRIQFITLSLPQDAYTVSPSCSAAGGLNASIQRVLSVLKGRRKKLLAPKKDGGNWAQRGSSRLSEIILLTMPNYASSLAIELEKLYANDRSQLLVKQTCLLRITVADTGEAPPLFLDQTEARRAQKRFFWRPPPPPPPPPPLFLKVWIRHCIISNYPFQPSSSLPIRASFCTFCVIYPFVSSFKRLFVCFTQFGGVSTVWILINFVTQFL